jgi:hypothetical protein
VVEQTYSATLNPSEQADKSPLGLVAGTTIAVAPKAESSLGVAELVKSGIKLLPEMAARLVDAAVMMLIPSEIGQDPTTYQLDGRENLRVKYDEDMLSGVIEQQVDGAWESTGQLVTPEYKNGDFSNGIVGFTIADNVRNASTTYPVRTPPDASSTFPALSDRDRQLADPSGGFQVHEGEGIVILGRPYPTDPSLTAPIQGFPADSGVEPVHVMMNESSGSGQNSEVVGGSTYSERLAQTPVNNGAWSGVRGESTFTSSHPDVVPIMGERGIPYADARPDFSSVAEGSVDIPNMSVSRTSNFAQADKALAEIRGVSPSEIKQWRIQNSYTWHEVENLRTMQLVPSQINAKFGHLGGVGEIKAGATLNR